MVSLEGDNLVVFYYLSKSGLIRGVTFGESGLIRRVAFGESGLIRRETTVHWDKIHFWSDIMTWYSLHTAAVGIKHQSINHWSNITLSSLLKITIKFICLFVFTMYYIMYYYIVDKKVLLKKGPFVIIYLYYAAYILF